MSHAKLRSNLASLRATSHADGEKWLSSALHPPTKTDNPGYPDSDTTASVRTNANVNYTLAPPGYLATVPTETWSVTIVSNPNNAYYPAYAIAYVTSCFSQMEENLHKLYDLTPRQHALADESGDFSPGYASQGNAMGCMQHVQFCFDSSGAYHQTAQPGDSNIAIYFTPIYDTYMPEFDEAVSWRCIGASNTTYLDCAEMYKQGMVYGSQTGKAVRALAPISGGALPYTGSTAEDLKHPVSMDGSAVTLDESARYNKLWSIGYNPKKFVGDFYHFPGGITDAIYSFVKFHRHFIEYTHATVTITAGAVTILQDWEGYTPGDVVQVTGATGSMVLLTGPSGVVKMPISKYQSALGSSVIAGPTPNVVNTAVHLYYPQAALFLSMNNIEAEMLGYCVYESSTDGDKVIATSTQSASLYIGSPTNPGSCARSSVVVPLDRQSMQAASEMMVHEAKHGTYQVSRLYDSENPYMLARGPNNASVIGKETQEFDNTFISGEVNCAQPVHGLVSDYYSYSTRNKAPEAASALSSTFFPVAIWGNDAESLYNQFPNYTQAFLPRRVNNKYTEAYKFRGGLTETLPSSSVWSSTVALYIGLSPQSTIQGRVCRDLEYIPTPSSATAALASPGAISDELAIFNGLIILNNLPVLMKHSDNDLGNWLKAAWHAVKEAQPLLVPAMSALHPAAGIATGASIEMGKKVEKLIKDMQAMRQQHNNTTQMATTNKNKLAVMKK